MRFPHLLRYELSKLFQQRFAKAAILLTFILIVCSAVYSTNLFYEISHPRIVSDTFYKLPQCKSDIFYNYSEEYSEEYFAKVEAERDRLTEERQSLSENEKKLKGKYGLTLDMDYILFSDLYGQCVRMQNVTEQRNSIVRSARDIMETEDDPYLQNRAELAIHDYSSPLYLKTYYDEGVSGYIENILFFGRKSYTDHILILIICFLTAGAFSAEHECSIYGMLYSTKKGRTHLFMAKTISCYIIIFFLILICHLLGLLVYAIRYSGIYGFSSSVQLLSLQFSNLSLCPFTLNNLQFILSCIGMQTLFLLLVAQTAILLSIAAKKTIAAFIGPALLYVGSAELFFYVKSNVGPSLMPLFEKMQLLLPAALLFPDCYFSNMNTVRIGDNAVYRIYILLTVCVLLFFLLGTAAHVLYTGQIPRTYRKWRKNKS